jgi:hypothetical protein
MTVSDLYNVAAALAIASVLAIAWHFRAHPRAFGEAQEGLSRRCR